MAGLRRAFVLIGLIAIGTVVATADDSRGECPGGPEMLNLYGGLEPELVVFDHDRPRAIVTDSRSAFLVDMTDPGEPRFFLPGSAPKHLWNLSGGSEPATVSLSGDRLYQRGWNTVRVRDLSQPAGPWPAADWLSLDDDGSSVVSDVVATDAWVAVVTNGSGTPAPPPALTLYDASAPTDPGVIGSVGLTSAGALLVADPGTLIVHSAAGLDLVDVANPSSPVLGDHVGVVAFDAAAADGLLAVLETTGIDEASLHAFDVSDPGRVVSLGVLPGLSYIHDVAVSGGYAYLPAGPRGGGDTIVVDLQPPSGPPVIVAELPTGAALGIGVRDGAVVVAAGRDGVVTGRLATPTTLAGPTFREPARRYAGETGFERTMVFENGRLYVETFGEGIWILDVSDPANVVEIGRWPAGVASYPARSLAAHGDILYVLDSTADAIHVVDASTPSSPVLRASVLLDGGQVREMWADGGRIVLMMDDELRLVDARDPDSPTLAAAVPTNGLPDLRWAALAIEGPAVVWGVSPLHGDGLVHVVDVSDPWAPVETATLDPVAIDPDNVDRDLWEFRGTGAGEVALGFAEWGFYGAVGGEGLAVDVTDPASPAVAGVFAAGHPAGFVADGPFTAYTSLHYMLGTYHISLEDRRRPGLSAGCWPVNGGFVAMEGDRYRVFGSSTRLGMRGVLSILDFSRCDVFLVFRDDFESGDASAWGIGGGS